MNIEIREYTAADLPEMTCIWNEVVEDGIAFPQDSCLTEDEAATFFAGQSFSGVAEDKDTGTIYGLYILHPNNVGRCGHISNVSYAVRKDSRGQHIGEKLVQHSMQQAREHGFRLIQLNAVVATNLAARHLYERLGFVPLGVIPGGFLMKDGHYEDICPYYLQV